MTKKLLTIEDLVQFCQAQNFHRFSAAETGYQLSVQVPAVATYKKKEVEDDTLLFCTVKLFHTGRNRNGSSVTEDAAKNAMSTIAYKPLLANFCEIDGVRDFTSHDMIFHEDGSIEYIEKQIGAFTADEPYMEYDKELDKTFVYANVAIPREYTDAAEIIERKSGTKVSVELIVNSMSYDSKEKVLVLEDVVVQGATCLGKDPETGKDVGEGMQGARLDIADFSVQNNSMQFDVNKELLEEIKKLNENLTHININDNQRKEDEKVETNEIFEGVTETEEVIEEVTEESTEEVSVTEEMSEETTEETPEVVVENEEDTPVEENEEESEEEILVDEQVVETAAVKPEKYSVGMSDGSVKEFALSLDEIESALHQLVNATYGEADNTYYGVQVYEDNTLVMIDWWNNKAFRQTYGRDEDNFSLTGDRVEVFSNWLTKEEESALAEMRSNYSVIESELTKYQVKEENDKKDALFVSEDYSSIADKDEFKALAENHAEFSIDDLKCKLDEIILAYAKKGNLNFAVAPKEKVGMIQLPIQSGNKKKSRYGSLFSK